MLSKLVAQSCPQCKRKDCDAGDGSEGQTVRLNSPVVPSQEQRQPASTNIEDRTEEDVGRKVQAAGNGDIEAGSKEKSKARPFGYIQRQYGPDTCKRPPL